MLSGSFSSSGNRTALRCLCQILMRRQSSLSLQHLVGDSLALKPFQEPVLEKAWPHLQIVYEFFLRFVQSSARWRPGSSRQLAQTHRLYRVTCRAHMDKGRLQRSRPQGDGAGTHSMHCRGSSGSICGRCTGGEAFPRYQFCFADV